MIPTEDQCKKLWKKYMLPEYKRRHMELVARVAVWLARRVKSQKSKVKINENLLTAAALLHDIDKNAPKLHGEQHPDTAVRILWEEGMGEVADLVKTHPLHAILDPGNCPKTWEEKLLFLADKMVKQEIITVDKRFELWRQENLPQAAREILEKCYPRVKQLEEEIFSQIAIAAQSVADLA